MKRVRLTQIDGHLPNIALMRLAHWHQSIGDEVTLSKVAARGLFEPEYDVVYGSAIFTRSRPLVDRLQRDFPSAILGGPGVFEYRDYAPDTFPTVEKIIGRPYPHLDYSIYPHFDASIGYTQRGCRFNCPFCPVPQMEGKVRAVATIAEIFRGDPFPRHLHLLDNDFFGQPNWRNLIDAMVDGGFKVCLNQGINVRVIRSGIAEQIARIPYYDDQFKTRRLYTAWDNIGDELPFTNGVKMLVDAGVKPDHLMVYMLIGFDPDETHARRMYRFEKMRDMGVRVYPMPYLANGEQARDLKNFQKWIVSGSHKTISFSKFRIIGQAERLRNHRLNKARNQSIEMALHESRRATLPRLPMH